MKKEKNTTYILGNCNLQPEIGNLGERTSFRRISMGMIFSS